MGGELWASETQWALDLSIPPTLHTLDFGVHGDIPCEQYKLRGLWCIHLYRYVGEAVISGQVFPIRPGFVSVTPPNTELEHRWMHPGSVHISAHFAAHGVEQDAMLLPAMQDMGRRASDLYAEMEQAIGVFWTQPRRAESSLWHVLWMLTEASRGAGTILAIHPAVRQALQAVEAGIAGPLGVADLAAKCGLSHNHFTRLFRAQTGDTVIGYIGRRRMEKACHLLSRSTLPIKAVAAQVGLPDLHQFNKLVRRATGFPPVKCGHGKNGKAKLPSSTDLDRLDCSDHQSRL